MVDGVAVGGLEIGLVWSGTWFGWIAAGLLPLSQTR